MNTLKSFLKLVEIRTKVASLFPFGLGSLMAYYSTGRIEGVNLLLMLVSLVCIDLTTTGFNHYYDYRRAVLKTGFHYQVHNPIASNEIEPKKAFASLVLILVLGIASGILLVLRTDLIVLALGVVSFGVGLAYSAGPLPISRTILGEVMSGGFMGGVIPFIAFYIHLPDGYLGLIEFTSQTMHLTFNLVHLAPIFAVSLPMVFFIGNIMLANNICDVEEDLVNKRYTLPVSIGVKRSLVLFKGLIIAAYISVGVSIVSGVMPIVYGLTCLAIPSIYVQTKAFADKPQKSVTFKLAVKNFLYFSLFSLGSLIIAILLSH